MNNNICIFDNGTGINLPSKVGVYPTEIMLGSTINEIHKNSGDCKLFVVVTHIPGIDFVVPTQEDKDTLIDVFNFGAKDYTIEVKESSMWYNKKAGSNIIVSDSVHLNEKDIALVLLTYLNKVDYKNESYSRRNHDIFIVINTRSGSEIIRTPNFDEAIRICDKTPCTAVINRAEEVVYRTKFGKVSVPKESKTHTAAFLKSHHKMSNGVFSIKLK